MTDRAILDVREMAPRIRHPRIFETFDALAPGAGFVLVNDHDPKPLFYQMAFERSGAFEWRYLDEGPEVWRVEVRKKSAPRVTPGDRVGEVAQRAPRMLEIMQGFGINHCCGAGLTLVEAAASAGADVETLVAALNAAT